MQQMEENGKQPQDQKKKKNEEETGNLLEKEFRAMIVKMIHNLGNKMEAQKNRLAAWMKTIQKMF